MAIFIFIANMAFEDGFILSQRMLSIILACHAAGQAHIQIVFALMSRSIADDAQVWLGRCDPLPVFAFSERLHQARRGQLLLVRQIDCLDRVVMRWLRRWLWL